MICRECLIERVKRGYFLCPCCDIFVKDYIMAYFYFITHEYDIRTGCLFCENCINCRNCIGCKDCISCKDC